VVSGRPFAQLFSGLIRNVFYGKIYRTRKACDIATDRVTVSAKRVLKDKFGLPRQLVDDFARFVRRDSIHCEAGGPIGIKLKDKDDLGILSAAVGGGVDVLVTGDKELQTVGTVVGLKILSPRQFWQELGKG